MVGGIIEDIVVITDQKWALLVRGKGSERHNLCAVNVDPQGQRLRRGDSVWWQNFRLLWSPKFGARREISLPKLGYSYAREAFDARKAAVARQGP